MRNYVGERIAANYFKGIESIGGHLYFGEMDMLFESHAFNFQTGAIRIGYHQIQQIEKGTILPTTMLVYTTDGSKHKFVVFNRNEIIGFLEYKRMQYQNFRGQ